MSLIMTGKGSSSFIFKPPSRITSLVISFNYYLCSLSCRHTPWLNFPNNVSSIPDH
jgi:hypothetical protein